MNRFLLTCFISFTSVSVLVCINPVREYPLKPDTYQLSYTEHKITTEDDYMLNAWYMEADPNNSNDVLLILAGSDSGNMGFLLSYASYLVKAGFSVFTFDYRGFGESSDFAYQEDCLYHTEYVDDFKTVVSWVRSSIQPSTIGVLSFSMGTLVAAAGYEDSNYDFFIGEGFILSPTIIIDRIQKTKKKTVSLPSNAIDYAAELREIDIPVLLFASTIDQHTTLADSKVFAKGSSNREVISYEGEHLRGASSLGYQEYVDAIKKMIFRRS